MKLSEHEPYVQRSPHAGYVPRAALAESQGSTCISLLVLSLENVLCASGIGGWGGVGMREGTEGNWG